MLKAISDFIPWGYVATFAVAAVAGEFLKPTARLWAGAKAAGRAALAAFKSKPAE